MDQPTVHISPTARRVLRARYLRRDAEGNVVERPEDLFARVARAVAQAELVLGGTARQTAEWEATYRDLLASLDFLPNSPTLMNAGTRLGQLGACFVLPVDDTMEGIFEALRGMALIQRTGGGSGFSFSRLRPRGDVVESTGGEASGPVSFMRIFDSATEHIRQGGRRRGANMGVLRVDHPDVLDFVEAKRDGRRLQNFNLSVAVTDDFMRGVEQGEHYVLRHPGSGRATGRVAARAVFDRIVGAAWETGDPGLLFLDAVNRANPTPALGAIETTNPCGEVPLLPYESCVLGSVNLAHMVGEGDGTRAVDWPRLRRTVRVGLRFLDDVVEMSREPLPEIRTMTRGNRKVGLGVMGFAEFLMRLGVPYDSPEAVIWADRLMAAIAHEARDVSRELGELRGPFPNWTQSVYASTGERFRNATRLSVAPTGTISLIADTSGGVEPLFALAYRREHTLGGEPLVEVNPVFLRQAQAEGLDPGPWLPAALERGHIRDLPEVPAGLRRVFVTAMEVPPIQHLKIQQAFRRHVDNAVSKTINLPEDARPAEVAEAYQQAWRFGLKGITVYRSGTKDRQVLTLGVGEDMISREFFARCDPGACRL